jgi:glycosyltransferase involved in cell wall biosynthesis
MRVSVVLSTYNSPNWLEKVLWGYAAQFVRPEEIVIADDGSTDETRARIEHLRRATQLNIQHVWHEDRGFRKCTILNRAIEAAEGDYLIFSDGDCIPRADFVKAHKAHAKPGQFLSGGYFMLPMNLSQAITREDIAAGRATDPRWLRTQGLPWTTKLIKLLARGASATLLDYLTPTRASWNGHNASTWKIDLCGVNGFDERMAYGGEDRELGERLLHRGLRPKRLRHRAIVVHLDHKRGYVNATATATNRRIWDETLRTRAVWTDHGLVQASHPPRLRVAPESRAA